MKRKFFNMFTFVAVFLLCFLAVGCDSGVRDEEGTGYVFFSDGNDSSRGNVSSIDQRPVYSADDLFWAYVAVKKSGLHTIGESLTETSSTDGKTVLLDGKNYVLRPVKIDSFGIPIKGLGVCADKFSFGTWHFKIYGYTSYDSSTGQFSGLVYSGDTVGALQTTPVYTEISNSTSPVSVAFMLKAESGFNKKGTMVFSNVYFSLPTDMFLPAGGIVSVSVSDVTVTGATPVLIATGVSTLPSRAEDQGYVSSNNILIAFTFESGKNQFETDATTGKAERKLKFEVQYTPDGGSAVDLTNTLNASVIPVVLSSGSVTVISGSMSNLNYSDNELAAGEVFNVATTKILKKDKDGSSDDDYDYFSFEEALTKLYYSTSQYTNSDGTVNRVILIGDIDMGEVSDTNCHIDLNGHYVRNIALRHGHTGDCKLHFHPGIGSSKDYAVTFSGHAGVSSKVDTLNFLSCSEVGSGTDNYNIAYIDGYDVAVDINAPGDDVWCTGYSSRRYTVTAAANDKANGKGCHFDVYGLPHLYYYSGFIDIGENVHITELTAVNNGDAYRYACEHTVLRGRPSVVIDDFVDRYRKNIHLANYIGTQTLMSYIKVNGNGGTSTDSYSKDSGKTVYWFGIEGMDLEIPPHLFTTAKTGCKSSDFFTTGSDGSGQVYKVGDKIHMGSGGQNLYCVWKQPVGGTIYFIRGKYLPSGTINSSGTYSETYAGDTITGQADGSVEICGVKYYFYDSSGNLKSLSGKTHCLTGYAYGDCLGSSTSYSYVTGYKPTSGSNMLAELNGASYYVKLGISKDDYIFVSKTPVTSGTIPKSGYSGLDYGTKYSYTTNKEIGAGKVTAYKALKSGATTKADFIYHNTAKTYTVWAVIDYLNGGVNDTGAAYTGLNGNFTKVSGCTDWYLPSLKECECMRTCGVSTGFNTGRYVMCCSFLGTQCYGWNRGSGGAASQIWTIHPHSGGWEEIILIRSF